jgi:acyl-homoserine lactone acylase PvdQ
LEFYRLHAIWFPFPYVGHNENGGWVSTDNSADLTDVYAETFDDPKQVRSRIVTAKDSTATGAHEEIL